MALPFITESKARIIAETLAEAQSGNTSNSPTWYVHHITGASSFSDSAPATTIDLYLINKKSEPCTTSNLFSQPWGEFITYKGLIVGMASAAVGIEYIAPHRVLIGTFDGLQCPYGQSPIFDTTYFEAHLTNFSDVVSTY